MLDAQQLTIDDALAELAAELPLGMSRLGDGPELGMTLLQPLFMHGWQLHEIERAFAGGRHMYVLSLPLDGGPIEVRREGQTLGQVACSLFEEAAQFTDWKRGQ